jgi:diguanylate cyclase (GGDEF)-like protein
VTRTHSTDSERLRLGANDLTGRAQRWAAAIMLVLLLGVASLAMVATHDLSGATHSAQASALRADAYQDARFFAARASGLQHDLLLHPTTSTAADVEVVATSSAGLQRALGDVLALSANDQQVITALHWQADRIEAVIHRVDRLVKSGRPIAASHVMENTFDPMADALIDELGIFEESGHVSSRAYLTNARALGQKLRIATPLVLLGGVIIALLVAAMLRRDRRRIRALAATDSLTGLPNRLELTGIADSVLAGVRLGGAADAHAALLLLDLDRFKEVNDGLGHHYGDLLLVQVAERLRRMVKASDTVARLGGDEFVILLSDGGRAAGEAVATRVRSALREQFSIDGMEVGIDVSIGIASSADCESLDPSALLRAADVAMYAAKENGGGHIVYTPKLDEATKDKILTVSQLRRALDHDELVLHYQPKVSLDDGRLLGVEALLRWQHPTRGLLAPGEFLPLVEEHEVMDSITSTVLAKALHQAKSWLDHGAHIPVAVNIATRSLLSFGFPQEVERLLEFHQLEPALLCLEITETSVMLDSVRSLATLNALHVIGVRLSVDDYGTGYASMLYLKDLPIDELKIDRSFVTMMASDSKSAVLARSAIELGHNLGLTVVAEGVEDAEVGVLLRDTGCDSAQGYFYSRPIPADDILNWQKETGVPGDVPPNQRRDSQYHETTPSAA